MTKTPRVDVIRLIRAANRLLPGMDFDQRSQLAAFTVRSLKMVASHPELQRLLCCDEIANLAFLPRVIGVFRDDLPAHVDPDGVTATMLLAAYAHYCAQVLWHSLKNGGQPPDLGFKVATRALGLAWALAGQDSPARYAAQLTRKKAQEAAAARHAKEKELRAWVGKEYLSKHWPSKKNAAEKIAKLAIERKMAVTNGCPLTETGAVNTIYRWIRQDFPTN